jgi:Zn-finger nucleic acid-binding protein
MLATDRQTRRAARLAAMTPRPIEPHREDPAVMCPRHDRPMRRFGVAGIEVDRCGICGGIWLDAGELEALVRSDRDTRAAARLLDRADGAEEESDHAPVCPRDGTPLAPMRSAVAPHVECDACTACGGVYLDAGELSAMTETGLAEWIRRLVPGLR